MYYVQPEKEASLISDQTISPLNNYMTIKGLEKKYIYIYIKLDVNIKVYFS